MAVNFKLFYGNPFVDFKYNLKTFLLLKFLLVVQKINNYMVKIF